MSQNGAYASLWNEQLKKLETEDKPQESADEEKEA